MSQQINLYAREPEAKRGPAFATLIVLAVLVALLFGYWQLLRDATGKLEVRVAQTNSQLGAEKTALKSMKDALATRTDPARLAVELASLKSRATEAQEIINQLERGDLGSLDGFGGHLVAFARIAEPGVWLTNLRIYNAGRAIEVQGRSLQAESVLRYAGEMNRQFAGFGASINALELTPVAAAKDPSTTAVAFKLF